MSLVKKVEHIFEPTPLQCGQAVLAMLTGERVEDIVKLLDNERETTLKEMFFVLQQKSISYKKIRYAVDNKKDLPNVCFLSLETPKCWHWSLCYGGKFYDPEYGVLDDFPPSRRRYYWEISEQNDET